MAFFQQVPRVQLALGERDHSDWLIGLACGKRNGSDKGKQKDNDVEDTKRSFSSLNVFTATRSSRIKASLRPSEHKSGEARVVQRFCSSS